MPPDKAQQLAIGVLRIEGMLKKNEEERSAKRSSATQSGGDIGDPEAEPSRGADEDQAASRRELVSDPRRVDACVLELEPRWLMDHDVQCCAPDTLASAQN